MVSESLVGTYLDAQGRESSIVSEEHGLLTQFAQRLQASSSNNEPSIVDETRQEAQLLMSLMFCGSGSDSEPPEAEPLSSSDHSCASDCSTPRRELFSFTCPSLSLEAPTDAPSSQATAFSERSARSTGLMGRALTVDDRDAVRLSADAMARNVLQSFQKAMDWRIHAWMETLAVALSEKESAMVANGADLQEARHELRHSTAARLILALHSLIETQAITAHSATVKFQVQPQRVERQDQEPAKKKHCTRRGTDKTDLQHTVTHHLEMECEVHFQTPIGYAEITIEAPGTIQGTFGTNEEDPRLELKAVSLDVTPSILSAMMEKSSRTIVRTCVEQVMETLQEPSSETEEEPVSASLGTEESADTAQSPFALASPQVSTDYSVSDPAFVTPSNAGYGMPPDAPPTTDKILMPTDLDDQGPRRISPQLTGGLFRGTTPPRLEPRSGFFVNRRVPLISPQAGDTQFRDVPDNGPSLPMLGLVEAACRAASIQDM